MKHPKPEQWSDYVRGVLSTELTASLEAHLQPGCRKCERQISALQAVLRVAETDLHFEPPAAAIRAVRNLFRVQQLIASSDRPRLRLDLGFDSFLAPASPGVRSAEPPERHLLFKSPELVLDLELSSGSSGGPLRVRGQLAGADSKPLAGVPVFLLDGGRIYSQDLSGKIGDFRLLGEAERTPRLCLLVGDDLVDLELPSLFEDPDRSKSH